MTAPRCNTEGKLMNIQEWLTIRVNYNRSLKTDQCKALGIADCYRVGKALYYLHNGTTDERGNVLNIKYVLVRPDIGFCESGTFDYVPGYDPRVYITDNYFSHNFNDF